VHQEVHVVVLAVELFQLGLEVRADLPHDLLAPHEHGVGHGLAPILSNENQMDMQVVDDVSAGANIRIRIPSW
jgi:hypothetical protein